MYQPASRQPLDSYKKRNLGFNNYHLVKMHGVSQSDCSYAEEEPLKENKPKQRQVNVKSQDRLSPKNDGLNSSDRSISSNNSSSEINDQVSDSQNSRATSTKRTDNSSKKKRSEKKKKEEKKTSLTFLYRIIIVGFISYISYISYTSFISYISYRSYRSYTSKNEHLDTNEEQSQNIFKILESIEKVKNKFRNQETYIWDEISSAINEIMNKSPKVPSIILLFANEMATMNCLATELADVSGKLLTDKPIYLDPKDFEDDAGKIIIKLNSTAPKVVVIHDILRINAQAIKALHNICDRINPLINEVIYILTMHTNNYKLSQKKMAFVEEQITKKLSNSIDEDILSALRTRITDGAIILVKPELHLDNC